MQNLHDLETRQDKLRFDLLSISDRHDEIARKVRKLRRSANHVAALAFLTGLMVGLFLAQFIRW